VADQEYKFLAINDWEEYQTDMKNREWIKDSVCQNDRHKFASLSMFERGVLQELRRLRGRTRMNIENDVAHIALAIHAKVTDRSHLRHAIGTLIARRILILTNQRHSSIEEKRIEEKRVYKPSRRKAPSKTDERFASFVEVLHRYHARFVGQTLKFELWFGRRGGRQLKSLLQAEPALDFHTFEKSVAVRARSPSVNHAQPVYEWISHVISGPKGYSNGNGNHKTAGQQLVVSNREAIVHGLTDQDPGADAGHNGHPVSNADHAGAGKILEGFSDRRSRSVS
jgi:hypothetical protein